MYNPLEDRPPAPAHVEPILSGHEQFVTLVECHNNIDLVLTSERVLGLDRSGKHQLLVHFTVPRSVPIEIIAKPQGTHLRRLGLAALGLGLAAVAYFLTISSDSTTTTLFTFIPLAAAAWLLLDSLVLNRLQLAIVIRVDKSSVKLRAGRRQLGRIHKINYLLAGDHATAAGTADADDDTASAEGDLDGGGEPIPAPAAGGSGGDADPEPGKDVQI